MTVEIRVDAGACVGHGRCYSLAAEVFAPDEAGYCVVLVPEIDLVATGGSELERRARLGADACPERAITVADREAPRDG